jgi:hypothetical protein
MTILGSEIEELDHAAGSGEEDETSTIVVLTTAKLAECTCPEFCERDHSVD